MDDQAQRRREAYRNAASNLLAFGHETDQPGHRVQSPTSGAWHSCQCSRGKDHVGAMVPADPVSAALAILAAQGVELPDDPVLLVVPEGWFDLSDDPTLMSWPPKPDDQPF